MKILVCATEYPPTGSGIGNVAYHVVEQFKKKGYVCEVCSPVGPDISTGSPRLINFFGIVGILYYWYNLHKLLDNKNYDIFWLHNPILLFRPRSKNLLVTYHTTYTGRYPRRKFYTFLYWYDRLASFIEHYAIKNIPDEAIFTAETENVTAELVKLGVDNDRIHCIYNGVDTDLFKPIKEKNLVRKKFGLPDNKKIILSVGRLNEVKNPLKLIDIFTHLSVQNNDIFLVFAGKGPLYNKIQKILKEKNYTNIALLGYVPQGDLPELYACCDYYILLSKYEGVPLTLLEAMSSGLPCIVSNTLNCSVVLSAKCGISVDTQNIPFASRIISEYIQFNPAIASENARNYAIKNLEWRSITRQYEILITSI